MAYLFRLFKLQRRASHCRRKTRQRTGRPVQALPGDAAGTHRNRGARAFPAGFTLIELLVVMLLITIVFSVTVPRLDGGLMQDSRKKTTRWVINTISQLRAMAIEKQTTHFLVIDLDDHRMWITHDAMEEEALEAAPEKAFALPGGTKIVDIRFPRKEPLSSGTGEIAFYPGGYSDQAVINLEQDDARRFAFKIEPLMPKVKVVDEWLEF